METVGGISALPQSVALVHGAPPTHPHYPPHPSLHPLLFKPPTPSTFPDTLSNAAGKEPATADPKPNLKRKYASYPAPKAVMQAACKKKRTNLNAFFKRYTPNSNAMTPATAPDAAPQLLTSVTPQKIPLVRSKSAPLPTTRVGTNTDEMLQPPLHLGYLDQEDLDHLVTAEAEHRRKSPNANLKPVWKSFIRLPEHMRPRYCRTPGSSKSLYEDKYAYNWCCRHCRQLLVVGCTKWLKQEPGIVAKPRVPEPKGCWQTTR